MNRNGYLLAKILVWMVLLVATQSALADQYGWKNLAGMPGGVGNVDGTGTNARFNTPSGLVVDGSANVYVVDDLNHNIRKITPTGDVTTFLSVPAWQGITMASDGTLYYTDGSIIYEKPLNSLPIKLAGGMQGFADGTGTAAKFNNIGGLALDAVGNVYVGDRMNHCIRKVTPAGVVTTIAGTPQVSGTASGTGTAAQFNSPYGVVVDASGNVFVADSGNCVVRQIASTGVVTVYAGAMKTGGAVDGSLTDARFNSPFGLCLDSAGNMYIGDRSGNRIRKITPVGDVSTLAGNGASGSADGTGNAARFWNPEGVSVDSNGTVYVADSSNCTVRKVTSAGVVTTLAGAPNMRASTNGTGTAARFARPNGIAIDNSGNLYIADASNSAIRKVAPAGLTAMLAGNPPLSGTTDGVGTAARFLYPEAIAVDRIGILYVADTNANTIRRVMPDGTVTTIAGTPNVSGTADGIGLAAQFCKPQGIAVDSLGNIFVADTSNDTIRKITPAGVVTTFAGSPKNMGTLDGVGASARFSYPEGLAVDTNDNLYVADCSNHVIRKVTPSAVVTTIAGTGGGNQGYADGTAKLAIFNNPSGVAIDNNGNVFVADTGNSVVRKITADGYVSTIGGSAGMLSGVDGVGPAALFSSPSGIVVSPSGTLYLADTDNNRISAGILRIATGASSGTTANAVTVSGTANPNGVTTTAFFQYGTDANYGNTTASTVLGSGTSRIPVTGTFSGLVPNTTYHYQLVMTSTEGTFTGGDRTFTTQSVAETGSWYAIGTTSATLSGSANPNGASAAVYFQCGTDATYGSVTGQQQIGSGTGFVGVNCPLTNLTPNTIYHYRLVTVSSQGTFFGDDQSFVTSGAGPTYLWKTISGTPGGPGYVDGPGSLSRFNSPYGVTADAQGNLFVADYYNHAIRKITPDGLVSTLAGNPHQFASKDGTGNAASFEWPQGIVLDASGNLFVADYGANCIRKVTQAGVVTTFAGSTSSGTTDGTGSTARFYEPYALAIDGTGNLFVADYGNHTIRKISPSGVVSTFAGKPQTSGSTDGIGSAALFKNPGGITIDANGVLYVLDCGNSLIRKVTPDGTVTTLPLRPNIYNAYGITVDGNGNLFVVGAFDAIQKITPDGKISVLAGVSYRPGYNDGTGTTARFSNANGIAIAPDGNFYIADTGNNIIRKVTPSANVTTIAGSTPSSGISDGIGSAAQFSNPQQIAVDANGNLFVADFDINIIRKISPGGVVTTLAGVPGTSGTANGNGPVAQFNEPSGVAVDGNGNVYVADSHNQTIRKITQAADVSVFAGNSAGLSGTSDGVGSNARFCFPFSLVADGNGNIYVADRDNHSIRMITSSGSVSTIAGYPQHGGTADGAGSAARFYNPEGVALDVAGNIYVADTDNHSIRKITPVGVVTTLAGLSGTSGSMDGKGSDARFNYPSAVAVDGGGNLYVADSSNNTIRRVTPDGTVFTIGGIPGVANGTDGIGINAQFCQPSGIVVDANGTLYVADSNNNRIVQGTPLCVTGSCTGITYAAASFQGNANPNGQSVTGFFQFGFDAYYGNTTGASLLGSASILENFGATTAALVSNTTYHYSAVAMSSLGTFYGGDQTFTTPPSPIDNWRVSKFGANANNPSIAGDAQVNNPAKICNLIAYALGVNPSTADAHCLPTRGIAGVSGTNYLTISFTRNRSAADIVYVIEGNNNLVDSNGWAAVASFSGGVWTPSINITETGTGSAVNVQVQDSIPMSSTRQRFLRLKVVH